MSLKEGNNEIVKFKFLYNEIILKKFNLLCTMLR